jgi:hypothetical protein
MTKKIKTLFVGLALALAPVVHATVIDSDGTVVQIYTYADFGGGDFTFKLSGQKAACLHGYWISKSQPGFATSVAMILQARATGEVIKVGGHDTQMWNGSSGLFCKVDWIGTP